MSIKTKLTSLITTFVLLCSLLTVGVFAVKNTTFNVGGDIVFNVQGIEATITRGATVGFTADKTIGNADGNILSDIILDNTMSAQDVADEFAPWSGLNLAFSDKVATIKLTIKNTAEEGADNYLDITALADATTKNNAKVSVVNDAGGITALLQPQQSASFTITFSVIDDEYSASLNGFSVNFDMQKKVLADFPSYDADSRFIIECDSTYKIASATGFDTMDPNTEIILPAYVKSEDVVCAVTSIADGAFESHLGLISFTIPDTVISIGSSAFRYTGIKNIIIPDSVISIGSNAFFGSGLESIIIPDSVTSIGEDAFAYGGGLISIVVESGNSVYDSRNNCNAIIETTSNMLLQGCENTVIPNTVEVIGDNAFYGHYSLESISIPYGVTSIGNGAFSETDLTSIILPASVISIGEGAFGLCGSLTSITIPASVTSIGDYAFDTCPDFTTVNYTGTQAQWNALLENVGEGNDYLKNAEINFDYKGE